jgi:ribosomal protein S18 acetylase RimI-like enzyme
MTGKPVGIFAAVARLERVGLLTDEEKAVFHEIDGVWFEENLPNPPFYDNDEPGKPITWFKTETTEHMIKKLRPLVAMLEKYAKPYDVVYSNFPGRIVYEDEWQVAVYSENASGRISPLSMEHLPMYAEVIRQSCATVAAQFNLTKENCPTYTGFVTDERWAERVADNYYPFGYFVDGKLVGFVSLVDAGEGVFEIRNLCVLPEYRHFGYGKELLEYCKNRAAEQSGTKINISFIEENTVLKNWYASNGFVHIGTKKFEHQPFTVGYMEYGLL